MIYYFKLNNTLSVNCKVYCFLFKYLQLQYVRVYIIRASLRF
jgi:hypothetical protein